MRRINVELLVGTFEACQILGLSDARICQLLKEDPTFPEPVHRVKMGPLWLAPELENWKITRKKKRPGRKSLGEHEVQRAVSRILGGDQDGRQDSGREAD